MLQTFFPLPIKISQRNFITVSLSHWSFWLRIPILLAIFSPNILAINVAASVVPCYHDGIELYIWLYISCSTSLSCFKKWSVFGTAFVIFNIQFQPNTEGTAFDFDLFSRLGTQFKYNHPEQTFRRKRSGLSHMDNVMSLYCTDIIRITPTLLE